MPDRIYVTYTPTTFPGAFHTAIHYERKDAHGRLIRHFVVEVQPEAKGMVDKAIGVIEEASRRDGKATRLGRMSAEVTDLMKDKAKDFDPNSPYEDIAEGDDLSAHFARMQLYAHGVNSAGIAYRGGHQNSNSFASGALKAGGLPAATGVGRDPIGRAGELFEFFAPGLNEPLKAPIGWGSPTLDARTSEAAAAAMENRRYLTRRVAGQPPAAAFGAGASAVPHRSTNEGFSSDRENTFDSRFRNWTESSGGITPHNPNLSVPPPEPGRPVGIVTGKPMQLWTTPPPIFDFSDRSAAPRSNNSSFGGGVQDSNKPRASIFDAGAPAIPFVRSNQRFSSSPGNAVGDRSAAFFPADDAVNAPDVSTGLSRRTAALAAAGPGSPERPTSLSHNSGLQSFNNDDELSWLIQLLSRRPR
jgi:hypothetical protein